MKKQLRNTVILGPILQFMFLVAATRMDMALEQFYITLVILLIIQAMIYQADNPGEKVIDSKEYTIGEFPYQAITGIILGLLITSPLLLWGHKQIPSDFIQDVVTQTFFVAFVETIFLLVVVRTMWVGETNIGVIVWPFIFAFFHPVVRENWLVGSFPPESIFGFIYAAGFGFLFWILLEGRTLAPGKWKACFGPVTTWFCHTVINLVIVICILMIGGFSLSPV